MLKVTLLVSGGNKTRTQDTWLSTVHFLRRWTKADNSREILKSKNADVAKRSTNPGIFSMGSGFKAKVLCAQRKALLNPPVHALLPPHRAKAQATQPAQCALNTASFSSAFPPGAPLPTLSPCCPDVANPIPEVSQLKTIPLQSVL